MKKKSTEADALGGLSRREREIMEIVYVAKEASVAEITDQMPDKLSRNGIRTLVNILENKGRLVRRKEGREFIYAPAEETGEAAQGALQKVLNVFFNGSLTNAMAARLDGGDDLPSDEEIEKLETLIQEARKRNQDKGAS